MSIVYLIISFIIASIVVQLVRGLFMRIIGANVMFFNGGRQILFIFIVAFAIYFNFFE